MRILPSVTPNCRVVGKMENVTNCIHIKTPNEGRGHPPRTNQTRLEPLRYRDLKSRYGAMFLTEPLPVYWFKYSYCLLPFKRHPKTPFEGVTILSLERVRYTTVCTHTPEVDDVCRVSSNSHFSWPPPPVLFFFSPLFLGPDVLIQPGLRYTET